MVHVKKQNLKKIPHLKESVLEKKSGYNRLNDWLLHNQ